MLNKKQPKINPPTTPREKIWDKLTVIFLIAMFAIVLYYYPQLPEQIPTHFNAKGEVDGMGSKHTVWLMPLIALVVVIPMFYIYKIPHTYNYWTKITEENAPYEYQRAREMIRMVNLSVALIFLVTAFQMCYSAQHENAGSGIALLMFILMVTFAPIIWYFASSKSKQQ